MIFPIPVMVNAKIISTGLDKDNHHFVNTTPQ